MQSKKNNIIGLFIGITIGIFFITQFFPKSLLLILMLIYTSYYIIVLLKTKIINPIAKYKKDGIEEIHYYRDELNEYSPMMNAKILGKDIFDSDVITAMILYLKDKGWNGETKILEENKTFLDHEKIFIEESKEIFSYLNNKKGMKNKGLSIKQSIEVFVEEDLKSEKLLKKDYIRENSIKGEDLLTILFFIINIIFLAPIMESNDKNIISLTEIIQVIANSIWIVIYCVNIKLKLNFISYLDEKGKEYAEKLRASKRYLKQYTLINDKNIESKIVFGAYVRNAIFFNLKGLLDKNAKDYYINVISKYGYIEIKKQNWIVYYIISFVLTYGIWILMFIIADFSFKLLLANVLIYPFIFISFMKKI